MDNMELLFGKPKELTFIRRRFDFTITPESFIKWLKVEDEDITGNYAYDVTSMCEYACLYVSMLFYKYKLKGEMKIYYGKFGFFEHYWVGYLIDGKEYFLDLTLKQFVKDAPELAIINAHNERIAGMYSYLSEGEPINEYVERQRAFEFYAHPVTLKRPNKGQLISKIINS